MKNIVAVLFLLPLIMLSGCWDRNEIEEIGFLLAVGLDPLDKEEEQREETKYEKETGYSPSDKNHSHFFKATYQLAIPGNTQDQEGQGGGKAFTNITTTGMTNFKIDRMFSSRSSRVINFEHLQVIIIHQELARQGMMEHLIDFFVRDHEMRRRTKVLIAEEEAKGILDDEHPLENIVAQSISQTNDNHPRVLAMIEPVDIGTISGFVIGQRSFIVPRIVHHGKGGVKIAGAAVFLGETNKMLGWLGEEEARAYNWIMEAVEMGVLEVPYENKYTFVYENLDQATTVNYERKNEQDVFHIEIRTEGAFVENWIHKVEINDQATLQKLEEAAAKRIEDQITKLMEKMQNEFHADIFEFYKYVKQKDYAYWKKVEKKWDGKEGVFSNAKIDVQAKVQIRHYMLNEKLED